VIVNSLRRLVGCHVRTIGGHPSWVSRGPSRSPDPAVGRSLSAGSDVGRAANVGAEEGQVTRNGW